MNAPDNLFGWGIDAVFLTRRTFVDALGCIFSTHFERHGYNGEDID